MEMQSSAEEHKVSPRQEFGKSFQEYFAKVAEAGGRNLNQLDPSVELPEDSFGQWHEADEGADD